METPCWLEALVRNVTAVGIQTLTWFLKIAMRSLASVGIAYATPLDSSVSGAHLGTMEMRGEPRTVQVQCRAHCRGRPTGARAMGAGSLSAPGLGGFLSGHTAVTPLTLSQGNMESQGMHPIAIGLDTFIRLMWLSSWVEWTMPHLTPVTFCLSIFMSFQFWPKK